MAGSATMIDHMPTPPMVESNTATLRRNQAVGESITCGALAPFGEVMVLLNRLVSLARSIQPQPRPPFIWVEEACCGLSMIDASATRNLERGSETTNNPRRRLPPVWRPPATAIGPQQRFTARVGADRALSCRLSLLLMHPGESYAKNFASRRSRIARGTLRECSRHSQNRSDHGLFRPIR